MLNVNTKIQNSKSTSPRKGAFAVLTISVLVS